MNPTIGQGLEAASEGAQYGYIPRVENTTGGIWIDLDEVYAPLATYTVSMDFAIPIGSPLLSFAALEFRDSSDQLVASSFIIPSFYAQGQWFTAETTRQVPKGAPEVGSGMRVGVRYASVLSKPLSLSAAFQGLAHLSPSIAFKFASTA